MQTIVNPVLNPKPVDSHLSHDNMKLLDISRGKREYLKDKNKNIMFIQAYIIKRTVSNMEFT
jgi:hypothetical protein